MRAGAVAIVFGTRPELVKLAPLLWELGPSAYTIHTGQHGAESLVEILRDLELGPADATCDIATVPRGRQIGEAVVAVTDALAACAPDVVVVQGDTNSTLAGALAATSLDLPLVHVEAGLRAFDRALPEERNRIVVDHLADLECAPTETAHGQLVSEGVDAARIVVTGNTVVDAVRRCLPAPDDRDTFLARHDLRAGRYILATFHRPENVDDPHPLRRIIDELSGLPVPVVLPVHPRTLDRARREGIDLASGAIRAVAPLGFREFLALEAECALIVTDSGGVQEEASIVGRPTIVVRRSTERPEVIGTVATLVDVGAEIAETALTILADHDEIHRRLASLPTPYGDGHAAPRTIVAIEELLARAHTAGRRYDAPLGGNDASVPTR